MYKVRPWLAIGGYLESRDGALLRARGIGALLHLESSMLQNGIETLHLVVTDGEPLPVATLRCGADFVGRQRAQGKLVLVACAAGISRSVTFAIAALHDAEGCGIFAAYQSIRAVHPQALPHHHLWDALCAWSGEDIPYVQVVAERMRM